MIVYKHANFLHALEQISISQGEHHASGLNLNICGPPGSNLWEPTLLGAFRQPNPSPLRLQTWLSVLADPAWSSPLHHLIS